MMLFRRSNPVWFVCAIFLFAVMMGGPSLLAQDVRGYGVFKVQDFVQDSTNAPVLQTAFPAYSFVTIAQPNGLLSNQVVSASVESPPNGFVDHLFPPAVGSDQPFAYYFNATSQSTIDAFYPAGEYRLRLNTANDGNNQVLSLTLTTNQFPIDAPRVVNYEEAQSIDAAVDFVFHWDSWVGGTTNEFVSFSLANESGEVAFRTATFGVEDGLTSLTGTNTSIVVPGGTLMSGQVYYGYLYFEKYGSVSTNYPGAVGLAGFGKATSFPVRTVSAIPPRLEALGVTNNLFSLRLHGQPANTYIIESTADIANPVWTSVVTNVGSFNFTDPVSVIGERRFYRAKQ